MLVANSFDLWQKDAFFSAAEEVQESADILESTYRTWLREKRDGILSNDLDELRRELQTALGTAKWQLEEFERAVKLSYGNCRDQNSMARHQQFIVALESQISRVEDLLRESLDGEGKQPLRWVNLDDDERDDLAIFLSSSSGAFTKSKRDETVKPSVRSAKENMYKKKDLEYAACSSSCSMDSNIQTKDSTCLRDHIVIDVGQPNCVMELSTGESLLTKGDVNCEMDRTRNAKRTQVPPKYGSLKIVIPDEDDQMRATMSIIEATPKKKGFRASMFLQFRGINCINKLFKCSNGSNSGMQSSLRLPFVSSMRLIIILMLSFFLLLPYLLHLS